MTLNESIVEDAALEWFGELGYAVGHGPQLAPGEPAAERDSFSEVAQFRFTPTLIPAFSQRDKKMREAIRRLNDSIQSRTLAPPARRAAAEPAEQGVECGKYCPFSRNRVNFSPLWPAAHY